MHPVFRASACGAIAAFLLSISSAHATDVNVSNPLNVLAGSGRTVTASSGDIFSGGPPAVIDNLASAADQDGSFLFNNSANQAISITGFSAPAGFQVIRIFTAPEDPQRLPTSVAAYSSTALTTSLLSSAYETTLGTSNAPYTFSAYDPSSSAARRGYFDIAVNAPGNTQSLLLQFTPSSNGTRVYEVQALAVPEPSAFALIAMTTGSLFLRRRRHEANRPWLR